MRGRDASQELSTLERVVSQQVEDLRHQGCVGGGRRGQGERLHAALDVASDHLQRQDCRQRTVLSLSLSAIATGECSHLSQCQGSRPPACDTETPAVEE